MEFSLLTMIYHRINVIYKSSWDTVQELGIHLLYCTRYLEHVLPLLIKHISINIFNITYRLVLYSLQIFLIN